MSQKTTIEWTERTWNPVTGCTKISIGCRHCYAERMARCLKAMGQPKYVNGFKVTLHPHILEKPLNWKKPCMVFVNSMSDLFHKDVPLSFVLDAFDIMRQAYWHTFQILTKRSERLLLLDRNIDWPPNVWMGVTVETERFLPRIIDLKGTRAAVKFLSLEPLLAPIPEIDFSSIDWVIVGGESGPGARVMKYEWVVDIRNQCISQSVPFFFKQCGAVSTRRKQAEFLMAVRGMRCQVHCIGNTASCHPVRAFSMLSEESPK